MNKTFKYLLFAICGVITASLSLTSCQVEVPETPAEELFLRNFIKHFGLIDESQDWNLAQRSEVIIRLDRDADKVVVYGEVFDDYYRVARCLNVKEGTISIDLDVPVNTTSLAVQIDDDIYVTDLGGIVDMVKDTPANAAPSRANIFTDISEETDLGWVIVAEDLGSTDDVDFNDVVVRMSYSENSYTMYGKLTPDDWDLFKQGLFAEIYFSENDKKVTVQYEDGTSTEHTAQSAPRRSRAGFAASRAGTTEVTVKALAAGGILKSWLHYKASDTATDYIICPYGMMPLSNITESTADKYEWHTWFINGDNQPMQAGSMINTACSYNNDHTSGGNDHDGTTTDYNNNEAYIQVPAYGSKVTIELDEGFTFTTYSQAQYANGAPITSGDFTFEKHSIEGFFITTNNHDANNKDENHEDGNAQYSYDLGKVIGHNRGQGLPPQMFLVPDLCYYTTNNTTHGQVQKHFHWPTERTQIDNAYHWFNNWVLYGTPTWYQFGRQDMVVTDVFLQTIYGSEY